MSQSTKMTIKDLRELLQEIEENPGDSTWGAFDSWAKRHGYSNFSATISRERERLRITCYCAACGRGIAEEAKYGTHRDGFAEGPEVPLCEFCGEGTQPTLEQIWEAIAFRRQIDLLEAVSFRDKAIQKKNVVF